MCLCILLQWWTIRSPCRRTATVRVLAIVRVLLISRGSWRVLYYYRIFSITTRRNPLLLPHNPTRRTIGAHPSPCRQESTAVYCIGKDIHTQCVLYCVESLPVSFTSTAAELATLYRIDSIRSVPAIVHTAGAL